VVITSEEMSVVQCRGFALPRFFYAPQDLSRVTRDDVVRAARLLLGVPFRHQGSDPATGLDCRGVIEWVGLVLWGRAIPARSYQRKPSGAEFLEKMRAELEEIDPTEAGHGDAVLLHFPKDTEARHGGILASGRHERMLIHAWENRGEGEVREEPLRGWKARNIDYAFRFPVAD
jgi:cell wall-associated NlpC family hydrolase